MQLECEVLECQSGVAKKTGNAYNIALIRYPVGDGRVGKVFSDVPLAPGKQKLELVLKPSSSDMFLSLSVAKVIPLK